MPTALLQQLAQVVLSLHQRGQAWVATHDGNTHTDVRPVQCVHVANSYCLWTRDWVSASDCHSSEGTGILLLSHNADDPDCHLSWIGCLQAVGRQEPLYKQAWSALRQALRWDVDEAPRWLLQLQPQYGRISRSGETDVPLTAHDLLEILHLPEAA